MSQAERGSHNCTGYVTSGVSMSQAERGSHNCHNGLFCVTYEKTAFVTLFVTFDRACFSKTYP
jgi:hypothetical protein